MGVVVAEGGATAPNTGVEAAGPGDTLVPRYAPPTTVSPDLLGDTTALSIGLKHNHVVVWGILAWYDAGGVSTEIYRVYHGA